MNTMSTILLVLLNFLAFILYGADKYKAIHNRWRIPERVLFTFALIGGSLGAFIGMKVFQHKTSVRLFKFGVPFLLIFQLVIFLYFYILIYNRI